MLNRYSFMTWAPSGTEITDSLAESLARAEGSARGFPPMADMDVQVRPIDVHEDEAGFVHPGVQGRDFYMVEYDVDLRAVGEQMSCPHT